MTARFCSSATLPKREHWLVRKSWNIWSIRYSILKAMTRADFVWCVLSRTDLGALTKLVYFAMTDKGLREITNPSAMFLSGSERNISGSVVLVTQEGTRPLLVEVQALLDPSSLANPRRLCVGLDAQRLVMLLAVLHRHGGVSLGGHDIFVNVAGGIRVMDSGADVAAAAAVLSSLFNKNFPADTVCFGEVGLGRGNSSCSAGRGAPEGSRETWF